MVMYNLVFQRDIRQNTTRVVVSFQQVKSKIGLVIQDKLDVDRNMHSVMESLDDSPGS